MSGAPITVGDALSRARALGIARLDAQLIIAHASGHDRAWVIAHPEAPVSSQVLDVLFERRAGGEPLAYLTGRREFHGLSLAISPAVLDPRPDTETLVDWALEVLRMRHAPRVIDLGTGSGAIALALKQGCARAQVCATDISEGALAVARDNGHRLGLDVQWQCGSWWAAAPPGRFDLVVANPPYVAVGDPHLPSLHHEPQLALVAAGDRGDGLADIERIVSGAPDRLQPNGWLLLEHGAAQAGAVRELLTKAGLSDTATRPDLAGRDRVTGARRSA
jgi:release factor glutamine methyltransferase